MRKSPLGLLILVIALAAGCPWPTTAQAQAFPAGSTALSAQQIVSRMNAANRKASSMHVALQLHASIQGMLDLSMQVAGDASAHPQLITEAGTIHTVNLGGSHTSTQSTSFQTLVVGDRGAVRLAGGTWQCKPLKSIMAQFLDLLKTISPRVQAPQLTGTGTTDGVSVWHVRGKETAALGSAVPSILSPSITAPIDLYISRSDFSLVRSSVTLNARTSSGVLHETVAVDVSHYGEKVHVALPAQCAAAHVPHHLYAFTTAAKNP